MSPRFQIDHPLVSYAGDEWGEFIRLANQMQVRNVDNVRFHMSYGEVDLFPELQEIREQMKADALKQLDGRTIDANPIFLLSQEQHDAWHEQRWRQAEQLVDREVEEHFFPMVRRLPLAMSLNGGPDVQFSAVIDLPSGCQRRTYVMRKSGQFDLTVERLPTLTLDTAVLFQLWRRRSKVEIVRRLLELAKRQSASVRVTGRVFEDVPWPPLSDEIANLPNLGIEVMRSVIRPHHWRAGIDLPGSREFADAYFALTTKQDRELNRDWKDWDHIHSHFINKRDIFLTWDKKLRRYGDGLNDHLGIVVLEPEEYLLVADTDDLAQAS